MSLNKVTSDWAGTISDEKVAALAVYHEQTLDLSFTNECSTWVFQSSMHAHYLMQYTYQGST